MFNLPARGQLGGRFIEQRVDSYWAQYYLQSYSCGDHCCTSMDAEITRVLNSCPPGPPCSNWYRNVSQEYSHDFACMVLAHQLNSDPYNHHLSLLYEQETELVKQGVSGFSCEPGNYQNVVFVYCPGWLYQSIPNTGADLSWQRELVEQQGYPTYTIPSLDNAPVEQNARIIADHVHQLCSQGYQVVLVSVSKSSSEVAMALGTGMIGSDSCDQIIGWLNVGGILRGSPLADQFTNPLSAPWFQLIFMSMGWGDLSGMRSITTRQSRHRFRQCDFPDHVVILNYVGIPISSQIINRNFQSGVFYNGLCQNGPNDGMGLIVDSLVPGAPTLYEFGCDHFFKIEDKVPKFIARDRLLLTMIEEAKRRQQGLKHDQFDPLTEPAPAFEATLSDQ